MTTIQKQAEQKVRALVPELQELSFGCVVRTDDGYFRNVLEIEYGRWDAPYKVLVGANILGFIEWSDVENIEIIGHPIHLEHILLAIERRASEKDDFAPIFVVRKVILSEYDLSKPFSEQIEEFYQFLNEIL